MLEVKNIYASYGKFEILKGVTLHVDEGEIVCMIGPNGAGKSTVFRTLFGFLKPLKGEVIFKGEGIGGLPTHKIIRKGISYIFQRDSVFPNMTVMENLEMGAYVRDDKEQVRKDIEDLCKMFPILKERRNEMAKNLSGGQRQMLEMARGLLLHPDLLLLDEPTLGLAPTIQKLVFEKIREINEKGTTIMIVEQNARQALLHSDRGYVLENGKTIMEGSGVEVLRNPRVIETYLGGKRYIE
ncbi:MAG: ABC transporter ATP-binding protein [Deltaproteobacteria bacterium]|nr:MAG: ABC transporter ATP-binding protein [Deltaproteobacteria bacterium]